MATWQASQSFPSNMAHTLSVLILLDKTSHMVKPANGTGRYTPPAGGIAGTWQPPGTADVSFFLFFFIAQGVKKSRKTWT